MRAVIRAFHSVDIDVHTYQSPDPEFDGQWIRMLIGPQSGPGVESFDVLVCTPAWLQMQIQEDGPQVGRHRLIVYPFDLERAMAFLTQRVEQIEGVDWLELGNKLSRLGRWEFEDYTP